MNWDAGFYVFGFGCFGGFARALLSHELIPPHRMPGCNYWHPGTPGDIIIGGFAAFVFWGFYGPSATELALGGPVSMPDPSSSVVTFRELIGAFFLGLVGERFLEMQLEQICRKKIERDKSLNKS